MKGQRVRASITAVLLGNVLSRRLTRTYQPFILILLVLLTAACATVPDPSRRDVSPGVPPPDTVERPQPPPAVDTLVRLHMEQMDLRARIGQRFMIFVPRGVPPDFLADRDEDHDEDHDADHAKDRTKEPPSARDRFIHTVEQGNPAGMIVYRWNYENRNEVILLTDALQALAARSQPGRGLLISADQEGGRVAAFRFPDIVRIPSAADVARHEDPVFVESLAYVTARELIAMGINMNLAPVLDLTPIPDASIIGDRAWGDDPELVSRFAESYVRGMTRAGVVATAKHFPGHGVTRVDSHGRLPVVSYTVEQLRARELRPFAASIGAGVPVVMTAHILFPVIDPDFPVTISRYFLQEMLRDELGFDGVVISDGLEMGALAANYDLDTTLERAIRFGVDLILLYTRYDLMEVIDRVEAMVRDGRVSEEEIDRGVERILRLKHAYGLLESIP